jgi:hypothetical protein
VERKEENGVLKRMLYGRPGGRRKKERPRLRWLEEVEEDLKDRNEWQRILEEA